MTTPHLICTSPEMIDGLASFFKMLGEPVRLKLLYSLCREGEATIGELVERLSIQQSVASKHMKLLYESGHAAKRKEDGRTLYYLPDDTLCRLCGIASAKIASRAEHFREWLSREPGKNGDRNHPFPF